MERELNKFLESDWEEEAEQLKEAFRGQYGLTQTNEFLIEGGKPCVWGEKESLKKYKRMTPGESVNEREMTDAEKKKREEIVLSLKKKKKDFQDRYGDDWENVMYATATKLAMEAVCNLEYFNNLNIQQINSYLKGLASLPKKQVIDHLKKHFNLKKIKMDMAGTKVLAFEGKEMESFTNFQEDSKMGKQSDDQLKKLHKTASAKDQSSPANKSFTKRIEKEMKKRGILEDTASIHTKRERIRKQREKMGLLKKKAPSQPKEKDTAIRRAAKQAGMSSSDRKGLYNEVEVDESTAEYAKSLEKIAKDRQLKMLSKSEKENLMKIAALLSKEKKEEVNEAKKPNLTAGMECQECGKRFRAKLSTLQYGKTKCPKCKSTDLDFAYGAKNESNELDEKKRETPDEWMKRTGKKPTKVKSGTGKAGKKAVMGFKKKLGVMSKKEKELDDKEREEREKNKEKNEQVGVRKVDFVDGVNENPVVAGIAAAAAKKELEKKKKKEKKEEAPVNVAPTAPDSGNIQYQEPVLGKIKKRKKIDEAVITSTFAGKQVFVVDSDMYHQCRLGKAKYHRYEKYVGTKRIGKAIREYGLKHPKRPIILQNGEGGPMLYLRYGRS